MTNLAQKREFDIYGGVMIATIDFLDGEYTVKTRFERRNFALISKDGVDYSDLCVFGFVDGNWNAQTKEMAAYKITQKLSEIGCYLNNVLKAGDSIAKDLNDIFNSVDGDSVHAGSGNEKR
jgi:hypothetical protein